MAITRAVAAELLRPGMEESFWAKVARRGPDECWDWLAGKESKGYGMFYVRVEGKGMNIKAHRIAWFYANGDIPPGHGYHGTCILHACDRPPCVNPRHLTSGTHAENVADRIAKGRSADRRGEKHPMSKLTEGEAVEIRRNATRPRKELAEQYGVSEHHVSDIIHGRTWAHVGEVLLERRADGTIGVAS